MSENMSQNHVITIDQEAELMKTKMQQSPKLLHKSAGKSSCCIFKVHKSLVEINKDAYQPQIVSIGPYHYGNKDLEMIQEHKWRFLDDMIKRTGKSVNFYMKVVGSMENAIRESYSESIDHFASNDLAKMMVLDGVFLIEMFRKVKGSVKTHEDDPIFHMSWVSPFLMRDLLKVENQIPFFVLQMLFEESRPNNHSLQSLILEFFNHVFDRKPDVLKKCENLDGTHLLDFFRKCFISTMSRNSVLGKPTDKTNDPSPKLIQPVTKLVIAGVTFKANKEADSFLDIKFKNGVLLIPQINMDDFYSYFLLNCMAFEQSYCHCSKDITTYVVFMGRLMNTSTDVGVLTHKKIIENYFGTDEDVAKFFNAISKDMPFDIKNNYLKYLFLELNKYCKNWWHVSWADFVNTYFKGRWSFISAIAAIMLITLAILQTIYTILSYYEKEAELR